MRPDRDDLQIDIGIALDLALAHPSNDPAVRMAMFISGLSGMMIHQPNLSQRILTILPPTTAMTASDWENSIDSAVNYVLESATYTLATFGRAETPGERCGYFAAFLTGAIRCHDPERGAALFKDIFDTPLSTQILTGDAALDAPVAGPV